MMLCDSLTKIMGVIPPMPEPPDQRDANKRAAQQIGDVTSNGDVDALDTVLAEDVVAHWPRLEPVRGREAYKETIRMFRAAFPDLSVEDQDVVAEGDMVCRRFTIRGTHEGEFMGVEPTGNAIEEPAMNMAKFEDGNIVEETTYADMLGVFAQLDVVEPHGEKPGPPLGIFHLGEPGVQGGTT